MPVIIDKLLRIGEGKILRQLEAVAKAVNAIEDDFRAMSDDELRGMTDEFRKRLAEGETLDDIMPEAFATVREAARRVIPSEVIDRCKGIITVPGHKHLEGATLGWVRDLLLDPSQDRGLFKPSMLDQLLTNPHTHLTPLRGSKLWQLAALNLWLSEQGL